MLKNYSFNLDTEKHKEIILWIKQMRELEDLNFSALIRRLLKTELNKQNTKNKELA